MSCLARSHFLSPCFLLRLIPPSVILPPSSFLLSFTLLFLPPSPSFSLSLLPLVYNQNCIEDGCVLPGAGAFEVAAHVALQQAKVKSSAKLGIEAFANALLIIPKTLFRNSGYDTAMSMVKLINEAEDIETLTGEVAVGIDLQTGEPCLPASQGIYDNYRVKRQLLHSWWVHLPGDLGCSLLSNGASSSKPVNLGLCVLCVCLCNCVHVCVCMCASLPFSLSYYPPSLSYLFYLPTFSRRSLSLAF